MCSTLWRNGARSAAVMVAAVLAWGCTSGPAPVDDRPYDAQIATWRAEKDAAFKAGGESSPLLPEQLSAFTGLPYYPIDPAYRVPAALTEEARQPPMIIELSTSQDQKERMRRVGSLGFRLAGNAHTLTAFAPVDARVITRLFVPFGDLSNLDATYRGGRYLELDRTPTGLYDLDFNRAYHPFCVYNPSYECPIPPRENRLLVAVRAGERLAATSGR